MIWPSCDTFFRFEDKTVTQVAQVMQAGDIAHNDYIPFRNMGIDAGGNPIKVAQVCYMCMGERQKNNMNYYVQVRPDGLRLASDWQHKQKASKALPNGTMAARQSERALNAIQQNAERKGDAEHLPSATEIATQLKNNENLRKAIDWVNMIGPDTYIFCGHYECNKYQLVLSQVLNPHLCEAVATMTAPGIYPLKSNMFYRLASPAHGTHETHKGEAYGAWFCAACAGRWEHPVDGA